MKNIFYKAGFYTLLILSITLILAYFFNDYRQAYLSDKIVGLEYELLDITLTSQLLSTNGDCNYVIGYLEAYDKKVAELGRYLTYLNDKKNQNDLYYNRLLKKYNYLNLLSWIKNKEVYRKCNIKAPLILFIYSKDDLNSMYQGEVLDDIVKEYNARVFAVASYINILPVQIILESKKPKSYPVLIIDGHYYEGFKHKDELERILEDLNYNKVE